MSGIVRGLIWASGLVAFLAYAMFAFAYDPQAENQFGAGQNAAGEQRTYGFQDREYPGGRQAPESGGDSGSNGGDSSGAAASSGDSCSN